MHDHLSISALKKKKRVAARSQAYLRCAFHGAVVPVAVFTPLGFDFRGFPLHRFSLLDLRLPLLVRFALLCILALSSRTLFSLFFLFLLRCCLFLFLLLFLFCFLLLLLLRFYLLER